MSSNGNGNHHALEARPIAGRIGAEIVGVRLAGDLDSSIVNASGRRCSNTKLSSSEDRSIWMKLRTRHSDDCWAISCRIHRAVVKEPDQNRCYDLTRPMAIARSHGIPT